MRQVKMVKRVQKKQLLKKAILKKPSKNKNREKRNCYKNLELNKQLCLLLHLEMNIQFLLVLEIQPLVFFSIFNYQKCIRTKRRKKRMMINLRRQGVRKDSNRGGVRQIWNYWKISLLSRQTLNRNLPLTQKVTKQPTKMQSQN